MAEVEKERADLDGWWQRRRSDGTVIIRIICVPFCVAVALTL